MLTSLLSLYMGGFGGVLGSNLVMWWERNNCYRLWFSLISMIFWPAFVIVGMVDMLSRTDVGYNFLCKIGAFK